jgi:membrane fusion protein, multidrug efflux system
MDHTHFENQLEGDEDRIDYRRSPLRDACRSRMRKGKTRAATTPSVEVTTVTVQDVPIYKEWIGSLDGNVNAVIRPQVTGYLVKQNYREGELVKKGQVLFEIDPRTFQASLDQAKGQLAQQQARYDTSKANLARIKPLAAKNAVSQKDLDDATGSELSSRSSVETAQAALENAQLNLSFTKITSPVDGIAGIAKTQLGNLVGPSSTQELTTVSSVNPICDSYDPWVWRHYRSPPDFPHVCHS